MIYYKTIKLGVALEVKFTFLDNLKDIQYLYDLKQIKGKRLNALENLQIKQN